jgi:hypothetical protein
MCAGSLETKRERSVSLSGCGVYLNEMTTAQLDPAKFRDPLVTAEGEPHAEVTFSGLKTLWINTGTLCNLSRRNCYIESTPRNDRLAYRDGAGLSPARQRRPGDRSRPGP